jgi:hypothetical protein
MINENSHLCFTSVMPGMVEGILLIELGVSHDTMNDTYVLCSCKCVRKFGVFFVMHMTMKARKCLHLNCI